MYSRPLRAALLAGCAWAALGCNEQPLPSVKVRLLVADGVPTPEFVMFEWTGPRGTSGGRVPRRGSFEDGRTDLGDVLVSFEEGVKGERIVVARGMRAGALSSLAGGTVAPDERRAVTLVLDRPPVTTRPDGGADGAVAPVDATDAAQPDATGATADTAAPPADAPAPDAIDARPIADASPSDQRADTVDAIPADAGPAPSLPRDPAQIGFETDTEGWRDLRDKGSTVSRVTSPVYAGAGALQIDLSYDATGDRYIGVKAMNADRKPRAGDVVRFRVLIPTGSGISAVQPYLLVGRADFSADFEGTWEPTKDLKPGQWNEVRVTAPPDYSFPYEIGMQFRSSGAWRGRVYVDSISW